MDRGVNDLMPGSDGQGILVIFEKLVEIRTWARPVQLWITGFAARSLGQYVVILTWGG